MTSILTGKKLVKSQLDNTPKLPGIYRMLDQEKRVIYIGKAKNLYKRLSQYTLELSTKNEMMISLTHNIDYNITDSEPSALLLEAKLIKKFKPKFNILLKDDKSFPFIKLREDHQYPQLLKYRGSDLSKGSFFGPFTSAKQVEITLTELQKIFKLRSCSDNYFNSRTRPCLQYEIKRCYAPCVNKISKEDYQQLALQVKDFLTGKNKELQKNLSEQMEKLSLETKFEQAAEIRDRIKALSHIQLKSGIAAKNINNLDVIAINQLNGLFIIELSLYRVGQNCGSTSYFPDHIKEENINTVLESFLLQFYQNKIPAESIIISHSIQNLNLIIEALKKLHNKNVKISVPKKGYKYLL
ncbi:MAG: excinuclease ABC subunit C, partial [Rickettsiaceae bacterium]|nr:excinuclease ABC subunit C [Rickettsiaceae bacterium]